MEYISGVILLVIGFIACFFGLRFFRIVLALLGFGIGYYAGLGVLVEQADAIQIIGGIVAGLIVGGLLYTFYNIGYILIGGLLGLTVAGLIANAFNLSGIIFLVLALVLLVIGAVLGARLADVIIRLGTAFSGATQMVAGMATISVAIGSELPLLDPTHGGANTESAEGIITIIVVIALGIAGFIYQARHAPER